MSYKNYVEIQTANQILNYLKSNDSSLDINKKIDDAQMQKNELVNKLNYITDENSIIEIQKQIYNLDKEISDLLNKRSLIIKKTFVTNEGIKEQVDHGIDNSPYYFKESDDLTESDIELIKEKLDILLKKDSETSDYTDYERLVEGLYNVGDATSHEKYVRSIIYNLWSSGETSKIVSLAEVDYKGEILKKSVRKVVKGGVRNAIA